METIKITIVQPDINWENIEANLEMYEKKLSATEITDLIILPEMFATGFTMNTALWNSERNEMIFSSIKPCVSESNPIFICCCFYEMNINDFRERLLYKSDL